MNLDAACLALLQAKGLLDLEGVLRIVDTANAAYGSFGAAANVDDGKVIAWHITDDPDAIVRAIKKRTEFRQSYGEGGRTAEFGPGLYVTAATAYWAGRARNKWGFMKTIGGEELTRLLDAIEAEVDQDAKRHRLSDREVERAKRDLGYVRSGQASPELLIGTFANQPYAIPFWRADWLEKADLEHLSGGPLRAVEVELFGKFAELAGSHMNHADLRLMHRAGLAGIFTKDTHQLCVWSGKNVRVRDVVTL